MLTDKQKDKVLQLYADGFGVASISLKMRVKSNWVQKFLKDKGIMRTREEGYKMRAKRGFR